MPTRRCRSRWRAPASPTASGCFNYGDHGTEWITEETPFTPSPLGAGHTKVVTELLRLHEHEGLDVVILAPGFVYGPGGLFKSSFVDTLATDLATTSSARVCFCGGKKMTDLAGAPVRRLLVLHGKLTVTF